MLINKLKELFQGQLIGANRTDQLLTYILKHPDGHKTVETVSIWSLGGMIHEFDHSEFNQEGHLLPVFTRK